MPTPPKQNKENPQQRDRAVAPLVLRDMRWVWENDLPDGVLDDTVGRRHLRKLLAADPAKYLDRLTSAEKDWRLARAAQKKAVAVKKAAEAKGAGGPADAEPDAGSQKQLDLIDRLLEERPWETE